jgi:hypothetical protein
MAAIHLCRRRGDGATIRPPTQVQPDPRARFEELASPLDRLRAVEAIEVAVEVRLWIR